MLGILKKIIKLTLNLNTIQIKQPQRMIEIDKRFNETFRFGGNKMSSHFKRATRMEIYSDVP